MAQYDIIFSGQITNGAVLDQVQQNLKQILRVDDKTIAVLFSGKRISIKKGVDLATGEKFQQAFAKAGAIVQLEAQSVVESPVASTAPPVQTNPEAKAAEEVEGYMKAFAHIIAPNFNVAPTGTSLKDADPEPVAPQVNLDGISIAPVGSDMNQMDMRKTAVIPDTSHIKLVD
ncbi:hypothetical protein VQ643_00370 [Pseudomonas sp. F1_0610]|uniref:hypothetical protein n=1 Tax=Pseudomonas sp. F1_0610 TaxID=3114284 RepID=UPI0039C32C56